MNKSINKLLIKLIVSLGVLLLFTSATAANTANEKMVAANASYNNLDFPNSIDSKKYQNIIQFATANSLDKTPMGNIVQQVAHQLLGSEYKAGLLDRSAQETLIISLRQFDCLLFIETVMAIANNINQKDYSYQAFSNEVENQRYWNGKMNGYCSRLHYFSRLD